MLTSAPGISALKEIDDRDTRREIRICLEKMTPKQRAEFVLWCTHHANVQAFFHGGRNRCVAYNVTGDYLESCMDVAMLISHFGLPAQAALTELEARASAAVKLWLPASGRPTN